MKWLIFLLISQFELPPGAQAEINPHIHNASSVTLKNPKIYLIHSAWWLSAPEEIVYQGNISPNGEAIFTFTVNCSPNAPIGNVGVIKYRVLAKNYEIDPSYVTISFISQLNPPTNLHAVVNPDYSVTLNWTDNSQFNDGYKIWRESEVEGKKLIATLGDVTSYTDNTAKFGHEYRYWVYAVKGNIRSEGDSFEVLTRPNTLVYKDDATFSFNSEKLNTRKRIYAFYFE